MYKISCVETDSKLPLALEVVKLISNLKFNVTIGKSNSRQITSDIDLMISNKIKETYQPIKNENYLDVYVENEYIGKVDLGFIDNANEIICYIEIEKSNKKNLWFDYVKLISKIENDPNRIGIVICPKNYAHKLGIWNLYDEAILYKKHLARLSNNNDLNRIAAIGYLQFANLNGTWEEFSPEFIQRLKDS